ncbi:hypothetical protein Hanom_Chr15g01398681 [Helianthus anomalus]
MPSSLLLHRLSLSISHSLSREEFGADLDLASRRTAEGGIWCREE